jgi:hypothetical protein
MTTVTVGEDAKTGDLIIPLPDSIIDDMGWNEDTILIWEITEQGEIILKEKPDDSN